VRNFLHVIAACSCCVFPQVLHDYRGWFVTFSSPDAAKRAEKVFSMSSCQLANRPVQIHAHPAPKLADVLANEMRPSSPGLSRRDERVWDKQELVKEAERLAIRELESVLERDIVERVIGVEVRRVVAEERGRFERETVAGHEEQDGVNGGVGESGKKIGLAPDALKGLSFRKRKQEKEKDKEKRKVNEGKVVLRDEAEDEDEAGRGRGRGRGRRRVRAREHEHEREESEEPVERAEPVTAKGSRLEIASGKELKRPRKRARSELSSAAASDVESEDEPAEAETEATTPVPPENPVEVAQSKPATVVSTAEHETTEVPLSPTVVPQEPTPPDAHAHKRSPSPDVDNVDMRAPKRQKIVEEVPPEAAVTAEDVDATTRTVPSAKTEKKQGKKTERKKATSTKKAKAAKVTPVEEEQVTDIYIPPVSMDVDVPPVTEVHVVPPSTEPSPTPDRSPIVEKPVQPPPPRVAPLPESELRALCEDDEDLYFAKLAMTLEVGEDFTLPEPTVEPEAPETTSPTASARKHVTGSARTEGYYKISHAEKSAYVAQYALRGTQTETATKTETPATQAVVSSRSNRANARRRAQGLEEVNQLQLAVALSKGETGTAEVVKFNQLQTRKKHLRFARSPIHDWGLYAMERILKGEMVIEYVGEVIRAAVADKREKAYERQGIGSSYLFRINEDLVVDATKKGNLG
jgi:histone-lysine N-methyltransferase SETD1